MKTVGQGANIRNLSQGILNDIEVPIPPSEIQIEIVNKLNNEQDLVNANKQLIEIFEQKIKERIAKVWGTSTAVSTGVEKKEKETLSMAAEPKVAYSKP